MAENKAVEVREAELTQINIVELKSVEDESSDSSVVDSMDSSLPMQPESEPTRKIMQSRIAR